MPAKKVRPHYVAGFAERVNLRSLSKVAGFGQAEEVDSSR